MDKLKAELHEYIATGYDYEAMMDIGSGWESLPFPWKNQNYSTIIEKPSQASRLPYCWCLLRKSTTFCSLSASLGLMMTSSKSP